MKKQILAAIITLTSYNTFASTTCNIKMVLNESQFFLKDFENVQDGFVFSLKEYLFSFKKDVSKNTQSVQILNQRTSKTHASSAALDSAIPLNVYVQENGRVMAEMTCRTKSNNTDPVTPIDPSDDGGPLF